MVMLRKCILKGPYTPTFVTTPAVPATEDSPAVPEQTTVETVTNMTPEKQSQEMWEAIEGYNKQQHKLDEVSYHKLFDILKQYQKEVNELRAERMAKNANPLALVATAQTLQDPYYQSSKSHKSYAPTSKASLPTRSHATTRYKGKEIAKPITPPSESASEEDSDPEQAQKDKDMQKNLALIAKYFKKLYKPTNNNLRTSSNTRNKNVDTTPRYRNDNQTGQFGNQRAVNVVGARETVGGPVVQQSGIQCFNCKEFGHYAKEYEGKPKGLEDSTYHKERCCCLHGNDSGRFLLQTQDRRELGLRVGSEPLEQVQYDTDDNVFANDIQHFDQSESISNTCAVETGDSNVTSDSPDMCDNDIQDDQNDVECDDERVALANLIANLKLDVDENKKISKQLKKSKCNIGSRVNLFEISIVKEKHDELVKQSLLTKSHYEGLVKEKTKVITDLKLKEEKDIDKMISMENQIKFLNEIVYKRSQSIQTIHMLAPKCPTFNGRSTFANPRYLKKAQYEHPGLYAITQDQSDPATRLIPDREEILTLDAESRSKLNKDLVKPFDYTMLNNVIYELQCLFFIKFMECDCLAQKLSEQTEFIVQLILFIVDSGCTKHMTGNLSLLCNFVEKYLGTVRFGNDQFAPILGYGDLVQGNITIKRVYYVEGLNHNLFSVGQFCDADLEVAFRKSTCFVRDLQGNDLLTGNRGTDLYTISLQETISSTPICLMAKASPTQAWLWHRRLSHLNFDYINLLSKKDVVIGLPKLKYVKDQLCSSCEVSKAKRSSFKSKTVPSSKGRLNLLHMDLCGPMRVASINGKRYILVIVDDYSKYTWTLFLHSKDETPEVLKDFLMMIQRNLQAPVISVRTDRGTEFLNKTLNSFFKEEGIEHQTSTPRTPKQNSVVERRNRTLVEAARTMLSASKLPLFFWAEAIATACYTQNRSIIIPTHEKTAYHIINDRKPSIKHLHIFGC
ncbi:retrovirus-related pol polyprotein from transposon TNT 1-94 [Tanacetum coccineum]